MSAEKKRRMTSKNTKGRIWGIWLLGGALTLLAMSGLAAYLFRDRQPSASNTPQAQLEGCKDRLKTLKNSGILAETQAPATFIVNDANWAALLPYPQRQALETFRCVALNGRERGTVDLVVEVVSKKTGLLIATADKNSLMIE